MKKSVSMFLLAFALSAAMVYAGEWTGYISDSKCGVKGDKPDHAGCAKSCISRGAAAVLVSEGKVFTLDKQAEAKKLAGDKVVVKGTESKDGKTIKVQSITKAS